MSDRLAVFADGRIEQVGPPAEVYEHPANEFVAGFVGVSNIVERDGSASRSAREGADPGGGRARTASESRRAASATSRTSGWSPASSSSWTKAASFRSSETSRCPRRRRSSKGVAVCASAGTASTHTRSRTRRKQSQRRKPSLSRRWLVFAVLTLALAAFTAAGCGDDDDDGGGGGGGDESAAAEEGRQGRGSGEPDRLGRLRRGRLDRSGTSTGCPTSRRRPAARST